MNVYIGKPVVVSDMQGPCDDGYHIPLNTERTGIYNLGISIGAWTRNNGNNIKNYLKMPFAGGRDNSATVINQGSFCYYWASNAYTYSSGQSYIFYFNSSDVIDDFYSARALAYSIRAFKNTFVNPTSSWTTIYQGAGSAGIFWNQTDGIISITSNGITGYTIQDKNLGATSVYNNGDTLSESNCGKYYQRGNNYGFAWTGTITTSSTKVNASTYGPGNYYSSSTFITASSSPYARDSSYNSNLRGGVSHGSTTKNVELKNAYIGDVWTPGSNTLLYMEFNNNLNDSSGKGVSISGSGIGYEDIGNKKCVKLTSLTGEITGPGNLMAPVGTGDFTVSFYIKPVTSNNVPSVFQSCNTASPRNGCFMFMGFNPSNFTKDRVAFYVNDSNKSTTSVTCTSLVGSWHHFLFTRYNGVCYGYIDGSSVLTPYSDSTSLSNVGYQWILNRAGHNDQKWQNTGCCMSELIVEKQGWDSSKAIHYFDITKGNYGL